MKLPTSLPRIKTCCRRSRVRGCCYPTMPPLDRIVGHGSVPPLGAVYGFFYSNPGLLERHLAKDVGMNDMILLPIIIPKNDLRPTLLFTQTHG